MIKNIKVIKNTNNIKKTFFIIVTIIGFILFVNLFGLIFISDAKFVYSKELQVANISIDTIIPKIELMNIKNTLYNDDEKDLYSVALQIKVTENNIKVNDIEKIRIKVDGNEINSYEINKLENLQDELLYEIKLNNLYKNQEIEMLIQEGIVIDKSNNKNNEQIIKHIV